MVTIIATDFNNTKKEKELQPKELQSKERAKKVLQDDRDTLPFPKPVVLPNTFIHHSNQVDSRTSVVSNVIDKYSKPERIAATPKGADELKRYDTPAINRVFENENSDNNIFENIAKNFNDGVSKGYLNNELQTEKGNIGVPTIFRRIYE